jgi:hypothetical protein
MSREELNLKIVDDELIVTLPGSSYTTIKKVEAGSSPKGEMGQKYQER